MDGNHHHHHHHPLTPLSFPPYHHHHKAFTKYLKKATENKGAIDDQLDRIIQYADVVRVIGHTQMKLLKLRQKKAHIIEIQV